MNAPGVKAKRSLSVSIEAWTFRASGIARTAASTGSCFLIFLRIEGTL
jgi:hypothetical protein